jgi:hypothetical protein
MKSQTPRVLRVAADFASTFDAPRVPRRIRQARHRRGHDSAPLVDCYGELSSNCAGLGDIRVAAATASHR